MAQTRIFVMDKGFVIVGTIADEQRPMDLMITLSKCAVVRVWGTEKGLGQLASEGPLPSTVLDEEAEGTEINRTFVMRSIPCNEKRWSKWNNS